MIRYLIPIVGWLRLIADLLARSFKSPAQMRLDILVLRHQLAALGRTAPGRPRLTAADWLFFVRRCTHLGRSVVLF